MQAARGQALAAGILFDSDMGRNIDAALALSMLYGLGRGRVIAVGVSHANLDAAAFCDILARFHGAGGSLPVGVAEDGPRLADSPMLQAALGLRSPDGQPAFRSNIRSIIDTGEPAVVFRNALLGQQDKQSIAVLAGAATNFARLLALAGARSIVAAKVRLLTMAAGAFGDATIDSRIRADIASARKVLAEWPSPIVAIGVEAGNAAPYPDHHVETELAAIPNQPVVAAYRAYRDKQPGAGAGAQAVLAALYAANSSAAFFKLSPPGVIEVTDEGQTSFRESAAGNHRYLIVEPAAKEPVIQAFLALAATRPAGTRGTPR